VLPFVALMTAAVVVICLLPGIATWLPDQVMGAR
jgi:C4-dicarboxylate transporter, DctM subunit